MNKNILYVFFGVAALLGGVWFIASFSKDEIATSTFLDHKNIEYSIGGITVELTDGLSEMPASPGSSTKIITRYFGNEVRQDVNGDGMEDVVFLVTQSAGGSGTFYYVVAALNTANGFVGTQGLLLGDRIAPQTTEKRANGLVVVNYAERARGESFAVSPSVGKSLFLKFSQDTMQFGEVVQNFEGEADPSRMSLQMKKWQWVRGVSPEGKTVVPKKPEAFVLTFQSGDRFSATTDCNGLGGSYTQKETELSFGNMISTLMYCEGSDEQVFVSMLSEVRALHFTSKGELVLSLPSGELVFK